MAAKQKILIVDDDNNIAELISLYLTKECFDTKIVNDGEEALKAFEQYNPNLILLDLMLPEVDGFDICRQVRQEKNIPIIMVSAKKDDIDKIRGLGLGADDYMTKPFGILELSARVRNLLKRVEPAKEEVSSLTIGEVSINRETREVIACGDRTELTLKEFELLTYLMEHINRVVTRDELLDHIWGYDYDGETRTLDMHIKTLRQKLHDAGAQIKTVRGVGYRFLKEKEAGK